MSFRARLALASALAVAVAVAAASLGAYVLVRNQLEGELDRSLQAQTGRGPGRPDELQEIPGRLGGPGAYVQLVDAAGETYRPRAAETELPVSDTTRAVVSGDDDRAFENATVEGTPLRIYTVQVREGLALQLARPRDEVDAVLDRVRMALAIVGLGGVVLAALLGLLVSRAAIGPLTRLADAAEEIEATGDLSRRVGITGADEVGRLGSRFDGMLAVLERSEEARRMLVADASHELRTPLTSVRTNVELLRRHPDLPAAERNAAIATALAELDELGSLVTDVVELARGGELTPQAREEFALDEVVTDSVERARRAAPALTFTLESEPVVVEGVRERAHRAVANLLDNARKWSPPDGTIDVEVAADGTVTVRDHGPGFDEADLPHVFDRFYRSTAARGMHGSGLGLAIVRQVAEAHGGDVQAANAPDGGAIVRLRLGPRLAAPAARPSTEAAPPDPETSS
jgi:two-component system, OmpR family, sensor histidine kinase MprB